jgi:hypothetical protein
MWFERATVEMYRLWSLYWQGHLRELTDRAVSLEAEASDIGDLYSATNLSIGLPAIHWLVRGRAEEGRRAADEALAHWPHRSYHLQHYWHAYAVAQVDLYRGDARAAWLRLTQTWKELRSALLLGIQMLRIELLWARGRAAIAAAAATADSAEQQTLLRDAAWAARRLLRERRADATGISLAIQAGAARISGEPEEALALLTAAADRAAEQEMFLLAAACQGARGRLLGGDRGAALVRESETWLGDQNIADPPAMARLFLPGLD